MIKNIVNLGDAAIYCDFGSEVNKEINSKVIRYFNTLKYNKLKLAYLYIYQFFLKYNYSLSKNVYKSFFVMTF